MTRRRLSGREKVASILLVAGLVVAAVSPFESLDLVSWVAWLGAGIGLVIASHLVLPFRDHLARYRGGE